jgi:DNA-binding response OmpR family regulator
MDDYLSKPVGIDALAEMARTWLERDQAETGESR